MIGEVECIENYKLLGAAVVELAVRDYADYVRTGSARAETVERFMRGPLFSLYTDLDPEYLIQSIRSRYKVKSEGGRRPKVNRGYS